MNCAIIAVGFSQLVKDQKCGFIHHVVVGGAGICAIYWRGGNCIRRIYFVMVYAGRIEFGCGGRVYIFV